MKLSFFMILLTFSLIIVSVTSAQTSPVFILPDQEIEEGQPAIIIANPQGLSISSILMEINSPGNITFKARKTDLIRGWYIKAGNRLPTSIFGVNCAGRGGLLPDGEILYLYLGNANSSSLKFSLSCRINPEKKDVPCYAGTVTIRKRSK